MAVYESVPSEKMANRKKRKPTLRTQKPGYGTEEPRSLAEPLFAKNAKAEKPTSKRQRAAESNLLDKKNKPQKVAGKSIPRDTLAAGAKANPDASKRNPTDKKVRGKTQK